MKSSVHYLEHSTKSIAANLDGGCINTTATGVNGKIVYDTNWPYFMSTQRTAFKLSMINKFDVELLIGQISYKQKSDIYNYVHGYISDQEANDKM